MIVCDRCLTKNCRATRVQISKQDNPNKAGRYRIMISCEVHLCEKCIDEFLKAFGKFKVRFMGEGDEPEAKPDQQEDKT